MIFVILIVAAIFLIIVFVKNNEDLNKYNMVFEEIYWRRPIESNRVPINFYEFRMLKRCMKRDLVNLNKKEIYIDGRVYFVNREGNKNG